MTLLSPSKRRGLTDHGRLVGPRRFSNATCRVLALSLMFLFLLMPGAAHSAVIDVINPEGSASIPQPLSNVQWGPSEVGWFYTPDFDYRLNGIETAFPGLGEQIGVQFYDGNPLEGAALLVSGTYTPPGTRNRDLYPVFAGISFDPLVIYGGHSYFVGFVGVQGIGVNVLSLGHLDRELPVLFNYLHTPSAISPTCTRACEIADVNAPILRFDGLPALPTPEPSFSMLAGVVLAFVVLAVRRAEP